jgi:hypothetical protein
MSLESDSRSGALDFVAFLISCGIGYVLLFYLPREHWAVFVSTIVSYHVFLAWLLITAQHETGFSFPIVTTILTHAAFMATVVGIVIARRYIPFFSLFGMGVAALAFFETKWLFAREIIKKKTKRAKNKAAVAPTAAPAITGTGEDYEEWLRYLAKRKSPTGIPGASFKGEYEKWLLARAQSRAAASRADTQVGN